MITPWRELELVHAVQRPLTKPVISMLNINRALNSTSARLQFESPCSLKSTARFDVRASWHEPIDRPDLDESKTKEIDRTVTDFAFSVKITDPQSYLTVQSDPMLGGLPEHIITKTDTIGVNYGNPNYTAASEIKSVPKYHESHDTRYRRIEYWIEATTRFREFMRDFDFQKTIKDKDGNDVQVTDEERFLVRSEKVVTWIKNSAPPPLPEVLYVIPTFGWSRTASSNGDKVSWRSGGGLRVYLDRPWNVTGYGEMLAVIVLKQNYPASIALDDSPQNLAFLKNVTLWGNDPIWLSGNIPTVSPNKNNFTAARYSSDPSRIGSPRAPSQPKWINLLVHSLHLNLILGFLLQ